MKLPIEEHFQVVTRYKDTAQAAINSAMDLHKIEIARIDSLFGTMDVLAFGIAGAVLALNNSINFGSPFIPIGMILLIGNAFWDFIARLDQFEINKTIAKNRMNFVHDESKKFLNVYRELVVDQSEENEEKLNQAGILFMEKFNENSNIEAPQTKLSKWIGRRGYLILYVTGMAFIAIGIIFPNLKISNESPHHKMHIINHWSN